MNFSLILTESRRRLNMTQREMAEKLNVSDKTISKWETGVNFPDLKMLNQISKLIGVSVAELLEADDLKAPEMVGNNDSGLISKFRIQQVIAFLLFIFSVINISWGLRISYLMLIIGLLLLGSSLVLFSYSTISFRSAYEERRNVQILDRLLNFHTFLFFESVLLVLIVILFSFYTATRFAHLVLIAFQIVPHLLRNRILTKNNYEKKKDKINSVLETTFWSLVIVGNLIYGILMTGWVKSDSYFITAILIPTMTTVCIFSPFIVSLIISQRKSYVTR
jgi:transcriptional regulator with XRE-family HTH domain